MKKWLIIAVAALVAGYLALRQWPGLKSNGANGGPVAGRPTTAVVEERTISFKVSAAGDIGPAEQVSVRPEINGRIQTLPVDLGDQVKAGDILFTLDDSDLRIELSSRQTEIEGAQLQLARAQRNFERSQELFESELISKELFDDTKTEFELAKNSLVRAQKNLDLITERLSKTRIVAPFDCTVLTRPVSIGQAVSGSGGFNSGTEVLTIADLNNMIVNAHVNQADVTRLKMGQEVEIQVESVPGLAMTGIVERIAPQSTIKNSIRGYPARIFIKRIDPRVKPGMTANLSIPVASSQNAVAVPLAAVFSEQGGRYVYVKTGSTFERRPVQIGIADYDFAEVLQGLSAGEIVSLEDLQGEARPAMKGGALGIATSPDGPGRGAAKAAGGQPAATPAGARTTGAGTGSTSGNR